jgi:hypothetical protein
MSRCLGIHGCLLVGGGSYSYIRFEEKHSTDEEKHSTHSISCLDSSLGRVSACDSGDPGSVPGGGKLSVCPLPGGQVTSTHYSQYKLSR